MKISDFYPFLAQFVTVVLAFLGWFKVHKRELESNELARKRDLESKRRDLVTTHLVEAYRLLANDYVQRTRTSETEKKIEKFISEIQLFGSKHQIELAEEMVEKFRQNENVDVSDLLMDLRKNLRRELDLGEVDGYVLWLRFKKD